MATPDSYNAAAPRDVFVDAAWLGTRYGRRRTFISDLVNSPGFPGPVVAPGSVLRPRSSAFADVADWMTWAIGERRSPAGAAGAQAFRCPAAGLAGAKGRARTGVGFLQPVRDGELTTLGARRT